jgi:hypothetical protein
MLGGGQHDSYFHIPLAAKKSYKVANEMSHNNAFTIQAYTWDTETDKSVHHGATPDLIRQALLDHSTIKISSASGRAYVNVSVKEEFEKDRNDRLVDAFIPAWVKLFVGGAKMIMAFQEMAKPKEVYFSITAEPADSTVYKFTGEVTLLQISLELRRRKAFAIADKTTAGTVEAVVGALAAGAGATEIEGLADFAGVVGDVIDMKNA